MKKGLFMFLLLVLPISLLANPTDSRRMIHLKVKQKVVHRSIEVSPADASVTGSLLEISFNIPFNEATISVSENKTGDEVYHEESIRDQIIIVHLDKNNTEYLLNIQVDKDTFISGEFSTE